MMLRTAINQSVRKFSGTCPSIKCNRLEGKIAVVTGSTDGIGFSIAKRLAQEGAKVVISSRREANVKRAIEQLKSEGLQATGIVCHVGKAEDRKRLFEKAALVAQYDEYQFEKEIQSYLLFQTKADFGGLDILVSNVAANPVMSTVMDTAEEAWDKIFDVNVKATYLLMQESLPLLKCSKSPSVIIVSSIAGYQPLSLLGVYSISKTALLGLTKVTADELACDGIRVNCIAPGIIMTKFSKPIHETEGAREIALSNISMGRIGEPDEIAGTAAFLASDDASYITGETIVVAGGMKSRL